MLPVVALLALALALPVVALLALALLALALLVVALSALVLLAHQETVRISRACWRSLGAGGGVCGCVRRYSV
ncbi:MAG: hypothetical protein K0U66_01430 [Gammaproteobacteria bacterium]|nr:hypothetical protein [Gammaproteobacteria bacterium]